MNSNSVMCNFAISFFIVFFYFINWSCIGWNASVEFLREVELLVHFNIFFESSKVNEHQFTIFHDIFGRITSWISWIGTVIKMQCNSHWNRKYSKTKWLVITRVVFFFYLSNCKFKEPYFNWSELNKYLCFCVYKRLPFGSNNNTTSYLHLLHTHLKVRKKENK